MMRSDEDSFKNRFQTLRKKDKFTDCTFKIDNQTINCHKILLVASSPVFEAQFFGNFRESADSDKTSTIIKITDISFEVFNLLLDFLYVGELSLGAESKDDDVIIDNLLQICYCSEKYLIDELKKICMEKLSEMLNNDNVLRILQKSFDNRLDDFCMSCIYYIHEQMTRNGVSFSNQIFNDEEYHLSHSCLTFLVKYLLDFSGVNDVLLCFLKSWCLIECKLSDKITTDDNIRDLLEELDFEETIINSTVETFAISLESPAIVDRDRQFLKTFTRHYYKPVKPLIVGVDMDYDSNVSFKRFVILRELNVNSRLIPENLDIYDMMNQTYTENIFVEIFLKNNPKDVIYSQFCTVSDVNYNSFFTIKFSSQIVFFPSYVYTIRFSFGDEAVGFEYPRCIFSLKENDDRPSFDNNPRSIVQFHEYYFEPLEFGSIIQGISYNLYS